MSEIIKKIAYTNTDVADKKSKSIKKAIKTAKQIFVYTAVIILALSMLFPYFYMVMTTFKSHFEASSSQLIIFPTEFLTRTYKEIWSLIPIGTGVLNTLLVATPVIIVGSFVATLAAFSFAKLKLPLKRMWLLILMSTMMIPYAAILLPQYQIYNTLNLTNTLWPLILPGLFGNIGMTFFLIQYMAGIPKTLFEAAKIDGCGYFKSFISIMFPLAAPAMVAQAVFWFLGIWNDFFGPSIYLTIPEVMTLQPLIARLSSTQSRTDVPMVMTGAFLSSIPLIALYLTFQRYFLKAMSITSGIKG